MYPEPGRPLRLPTDTADAAGLLQITQALLDMEPTAPRSASMRVLREVLWFSWEQPRLPRPLVQSKYPRSYPWSPAAAKEANEPYRPGGRGLIMEHLRPRRLLVVELLARASTVTPEDLAALLHQHITTAVITVEEDRLLSASKLNFSMPAGDDGTDPWARYVAAGLDPASFAPV